jgi:hypothetical protein
MIVTLARKSSRQSSRVSWPSSTMVSRGTSRMRNRAYGLT